MAFFAYCVCTLLCHSASAFNIFFLFTYQKKKKRKKKQSGESEVVGRHFSLMPDAKLEGHGVNTTGCTLSIGIGSGRGVGIV